jgi:hypothetical protein
MLKVLPVVDFFIVAYIHSNSRLSYRNKINLFLQLEDSVCPASTTPTFGALNERPVKAELLYIGRRHQSNCHKPCSGHSSRWILDSGGSHEAAYFSAGSESGLEYANREVEMKPRK